MIVNIVFIKIFVNSNFNMITMIECSFCGEKIDEDDRQYDCPYCGEMDYGEGYWSCPNCGELIDLNGEAWVCEHCQNDGPTAVSVEYDICPSCGGIIADDGYCEDCGENEDVNQGWLGENYG